MLRQLSDVLGVEDAPIRIQLGNQKELQAKIKIIDNWMSE